MRVIAGEVRGFKLKSIPGKHTRPTTDRVKESVFNVLQPYIQGVNFLDLFAGFGGIGIEALSRGAGHVDFVEKDKRNCRIIKENLQKTGLSSRAVLKRCDVLQYDSQTKFDIVFMDPPYNKGYVNKVLIHVRERELINKDSLVVVEHAPGEEIDCSFFEKIKEKSYGDTRISYLKLL